MRDQETLAQLERLQSLTQDLIAQCESRLAQVTAIASDLEPILAAHSAITSLGDLDAKLAQLDTLGNVDTSAITAVLADAAQQTAALQAALAAASQWQIDLVAQKSELETLAATVASQAELVASAAAEVKDNLAASDQVSQSILERLDRLNTLAPALGEVSDPAPVAGSTAPGLAVNVPPDLEQRLLALETALPTTTDWLNQVEASVQELQAFSEGLNSQRDALQALIAEGTAHLNSLLVRGQTQIAEVVGSQQEHLSALITEASQRAEQAHSAVAQLEQQLPALQTAISQAEAVLAQLTPLGETITTQLAELTRLSSLELPSLPDTAALDQLMQQLAQAQESLTAQLAEHQSQMQQAAQETSLAIATLKDSTEADLSQRLFALSEAAIGNVREALESLVLPGTSASAETAAATALLSQVTEVQERLFEQQQSFASQLEASVQVQTGLETQMQQWQSLIESVDLNGLALRLEQLEQTAAALTDAATGFDPALLDGLTARLNHLEGETVNTLQQTIDSLCDRTAELHSQLQGLKEQPATASPDLTAQLANLEERYQMLAAQYQQLHDTPVPAELQGLPSDLDGLRQQIAQHYSDINTRLTALTEASAAPAPAAVDLGAIESLTATVKSLNERYTSLEQAVALQMAAETDTDLDALEAAYRLLHEKVTALETQTPPPASTETVSLADFQALQAEHQSLRDRYETLQSSQNTLIEATKALLKRVKALES